MAQDCSSNGLTALAAPLQGLDGLEWDVMIALLCIIANNGTGGGGATQVFAGNFAGASPAAFVTPTTTVAIAFDTSNGTQWNFYSGVWN